MKVEYQSRGGHWSEPVLCVTHSDRAVHHQGCGLNELQQRYTRSDRLPPSVDFYDLTHASQHSPYGGSVTVWRLPNDLDGPAQLLTHFHPADYKPQHTVFYNGRLWVLGTEILEVYTPEMARIERITDPWLSGGHTVFPNGNGTLYLSCSASDSVLSVSASDYQIKRAWRLPEAIYGNNYPLQRHDSVVEHFIPNDLQLTHVNCASPWRDRILVSTLIQGAIGYFDAGGQYKELTRGFVGCHGARAIGNDVIYFCDSCLGAVVYMQTDGSIIRRLDLDSIWLHDAEHLDPDHIVVCAADRNQVEIVDAESGERVLSIDCSDFGESTQFVYFGH